MPSSSRRTAAPQQRCRGGPGSLVAPVRDRLLLTCSFSPAPGVQLQYALLPSCKFPPILATRVSASPCLEHLGMAWGTGRGSRAEFRALCVVSDNISQYISSTIFFIYQKMLKKAPPDSQNAIGSWGFSPQEHRVRLPPSWGWCLAPTPTRLCPGESDPCSFCVQGSGCPPSPVPTSHLPVELLPCSRERWGR